MKQKAFYLNLLRGMRDGSLKEKHIPGSRRTDLQQNAVRQATGSPQRSGEERQAPTDVLFIALDYKPNPGGVAAYLDSLVRGLISLGNNAKVLSLVEGKDEQRLAFLRSYEEWVIPLEVAYDTRPRNWLSNKCVSLLEIARCAKPRAWKWLDTTSWFKASSESVDRIRGVLEKEKPALVVIGHLELKLYPLVLYLRENRVPYGIIAHDSEIHFFPYRLNDRIRRGMMVKGAKWIAANSRHTKSHVEAWGVAPENVIIVHPPLSERAINVSHELPPIARSGVYTLVTVARIVHNKGIDIVLRALKILDRNHVPYRYVVAGEGPQRASLQDLAVEMRLQENVHFAGYVSEEDKWHLLQSADVFVMPSRVHPSQQHEGFGIAFLEAAAAGIAAIGSNAGGIPDAIVDGKTGILVEPESPEELAKALMALYRNPERRKEMGQAGMERAKSQFSPQAVASHFLHEVLGRPGR